MQTFEEMGLSVELIKALNEASIVTPTEIQSRAVPLLLEKKTDLIALAQTGTGKTASFGIPLIEKVQTDSKHIQAVVLSPTRELTQQIAQGLKTFSKYKRGVKVEVVFGGASISGQIKDIKKNKPQIIVATPGRLIDLINRKVVDLSGVDYVVLDEADEMLNMGFKEDMYEIISHTPDTKQLWLFSATMAKEIRGIVNQFMQNEEEIRVDAAQKVNKNIEHQYCVTNRGDKTKAIQRFVTSYPDMYGVIFCKTKMDTQKVADDLSRDGITAEALNGDLSQAQRDNVMKKFRKKSVNLLVATDVAARGIDVDDITHVFHHSLPDDTEYYTHRSGRTARAGKKGISISLLSASDQKRVSYFERKLQIDWKKVRIPDFEDIKGKRITSWVESILGEAETDIDIPATILDEVSKKFESLDKTALLSLLLKKELKSLDQGDERDLNVIKSSKNSIKDRKERKNTDTVSKGNRRINDTPMEWFYINVGRMDKMSIGELASLISSKGKLKRGQLGDIDMENRHSYFEVDKKMARNIAERFKGEKLRGRELRVNRESGRK